MFNISQQVKKTNWKQPEQDFQKKLIFLSILIFGITFFIGCENPITGYGPQPSYFEEQEHIPMLNVFGVLRPGNTGDNPLSFIHLEKSFPYTVFPDTVVIKDAKVTIFRYEENKTVDSLNFSYTNFNSVFLTTEYRHPDFFPIAGLTYGISCNRDGFPELTSKTTVPFSPQIVNDSIQVSTGKLSFYIQRDPLVALYDIYLITEQNVFTQRVQMPEVGDTQVTMDFQQNGKTEALLMIYAYDLKLSEYITYNVTIKPNTYRSDYSTVENGYGCFGSLNVLEKIISL